MVGKTSLRSRIMRKVKRGVFHTQGLVFSGRVGASPVKGEFFMYPIVWPLKV